MSLKSAVTDVVPFVRPMRELAAAARNRVRRLATPAILAKFDRLHLGSGSRHLHGWANLDVVGSKNIIWDLRKPLPIRAGQVRFVYSEHFVEHITRADCLILLRNVARCLAPGGVVRISTPDLRVLCHDYLAGKVVQMPHGEWFPETPCQMLNEAMRLWGHTYVYDETELGTLLREAGFSRVRRVKRSESDHPEMRNLETRPDFGDLIVEAQL